MKTAILMMFVALVSLPAFAGQEVLFTVNARVPDAKGKQQQMMQIPFYAITDATGAIQEIYVQVWNAAFHIPPSAIRNASQSLSFQGIEFATVQGGNLNAAGEGPLRVALNSRFAGKAASTLDFRLKRVGPQKHWAAFRGNQVVSTVTLDLNGDPYKMSALALMFSPPAIDHLSFTTYGCSAADLVDFQQKFATTAYHKSLHCDFGKLKPTEVRELVSRTVSRVGGSAFETAYVSPLLSGNVPAARPEAALAALLQFKDVGVDLGRYQAAEFPDNSLFRSAIDNGNRPVFDYLVQLGFQPGDNSTFETSLLNVYQVDSKKKQVVESPTGRYFFEKAKAAHQGKVNLTDVFLLPVGYEAVATASVVSSFREYQSLYYDYLYKTAELLLREGWDPRQKDSEWKQDAFAIVAEGHDFPEAQKKRFHLLFEKGIASLQAEQKARSLAAAATAEPTLASGAASAQ